MSRSDSSRYRARLTGWVDMGRKESKYEREMDSLRFRLHAGRMVTARDELFTQLDFMPQKVDWGWEMGYSHRIGMGTTPMLRYDMREKRFVLGAMQRSRRAGSSAMSTASPTTSARPGSSIRFTTSSVWSTSSTRHRAGSASSGISECSAGEILVDPCEVYYNKRVSLES